MVIVAKTNLSYVVKEIMWWADHQMGVEDLLAELRRRGIEGSPLTVSNLRLAYLQHLKFFKSVGLHMSWRKPDHHRRGKRKRRSLISSKFEDFKPAITPVEKLNGGGDADRWQRKRAATNYHRYSHSRSGRVKDRQFD